MTERERQILSLLREDPTLSAAVIARRLKTSAAAVTVHLSALRQQGASVVVAVPVAPPDACAELQEEVDAVVCASTPEPFYAVGLWYADFDQTTDAEVGALLERAAVRTSRAA